MVNESPVEPGKEVLVLRIPTPSEIVPEDYAKDLIEQLRATPQVWVYVITTVLCRPTPGDMIKDREGPRGSRLYYVEGAYAKNTCAALARIGVSSDFEIVQTDVDSESVQCLGKLTLKYWLDSAWSTISKMQWGNCSRRSGVPLGSTKKGAATDALKKCLNEFGWAMDVYTTEMEWSPPPSKEDMMAKSLETLYDMGVRASMTRDETIKWVGVETDGKTPEELDVKDLAAVKRKLRRMEVGSGS